MQFSIIALLSAAVLAAPAVAQSVSYSGFASTVSCSGSSFGCTDGGGVCCSLPTGFGFSAQFNNLPSGSQGQGYTGSTCANFRFAVFGPGTKCQSLGGDRVSHLNWFHSPQGRRAVQAREVEGSAKNCSTPSFFKYEVNGAERTIKVPQGEEAAQTIADYYHANNLSALDSYEDF
ncbi:hypothetical protein BDN70DRAFT_938814 [Pholiota conissans]|uniref:Uncharacterized protein n=1 Tax=Pholiota conissans TaxID=109636 RepID=A0A9P6CLV6_9AGAR|nr:hypothetical protein BDN70DRAFT_938814 [Pholiota conissans]